MKTALITGGSKGFGRALTLQLIDDGWHVIVDARHRDQLADLTRRIGHVDRLVTVTGDVADPEHRAALRRAVENRSELHLLVNNASTLGPTPLPPLSRTSAEDFERVLRTNTIAPVALSNQLLPLLARSSGTVVNVSSDAAVEHYERWGLYGAAKAALDHATLTSAVEHPDIRWIAFDPGDLRTDLHQEAFPGEDISDRPDPSTVVPVLLRLLDSSVPSGRYRAADLATVAAGWTS